MALSTPASQFIFFGLGAITGYFLANRQCRQLTKDLDTLNAILIEKENEIERLEQHVERLLEGYKANDIFVPSPDNTDNLTAIDGIGPKIQELLHTHNILSFEQLATTSLDTLNKILNSAGSTYSLHDPSSWPIQARLITEEGKAALKNWIKEHKSS
ncbi:hypothetical protein [Membranihabitans marinus]|uniref:hypothetical protein n=1 Tax=Membranihabitans marinus TaxID=1227546 RepID=UPI001F410292|nr:hypothetical protein [Membranihabitans marinus]